ncbi:RHS repeat-associated core domain-containing protein [Luteibacter sp. PPL201]|uniref:RHS repeat-associated core domain-containing protein n=1 Tax=Luteibacter sahnii TaxID=3021977 RepID=A0ABT6B950_9GAMM
MGRWASIIALLVLALMAAFLGPVHAQDHPGTSGPPYWFSYSIKGSGTYVVHAPTLDAVSDLGAQAMALIYGDNVTSSEMGYTTDGRPYFFTVQCYVHVKYFNPDPNGYAVARVEYTEDYKGGVACTNNHQFLLVYPTSQAYDIGKNRGGCPCTGGNGSDAPPPPASNNDGDPVNVATGNKYEEVVDYAAPTPWLTLRRFYNSSPADKTGALGALWRHSFDRSLHIVLPTVINLYRPDGRFERFTRQTDGTWKADADVNDRITEQTGSDGALTGYSAFIAGTRETETYSITGTLLSITDTTGAVTSLTYSDAATPVTVAPKPGLLTTVQDPNGRQLALTYDAQSRLQTVQQPDGGILAYAYDKAGYLTSVTHPDGTATQYLYDETAHVTTSSNPGLLTGVIDEKAVRFQTTSYNASSKVYYASMAGGAGAITLANDYGSSIDVTNALGLTSRRPLQTTLGAKKITGSSLPCGPACNQPWATITYDANGNPYDATDFRGGKTHTDYVGGLIVKQVDAVGTPQQRTSTREWDTAHRLPLKSTLTDKDGTFVQAQGWAYNDRQQLTAECTLNASAATTYTCGSQADAPAGVSQTRYTYCDAVDGVQCPRVGLLLAIDGPRQDVNDAVRYSYYTSTDESGCGTNAGPCHRVGDLNQTTDGQGHALTIEAYDKAGRVVRRRDANGVLTDVIYNQRGWPASRTVRAKTDGTASAGDATTLLEYDLTGTLHRVTDPDGVTTTYGYDDAHRLTDVTDGAGNRRHYTLDAAGNVVQEQILDPAGTVTWSVSRTYNNLSQVIRVADGRGQVVFDASATGDYDPNGNLVHSVGANGVQKENKYDALNRMVSAIADAHGSTASTANTTTSFILDTLDRLTAVTDPNGLTTTYGFDDLGYPKSLVSPDTGASSGTSDVAGHVLTHTDAKGVTVSHAYDALGRVTTDSYIDSSLNVSYHYDEANGVTGCTRSAPVGRLTRIVESAVTTTYCYDNEGRVTEQRQKQGSVTDTTTYAYTLAGRLSGIAMPSGAIVVYTRNALGQITAISATPSNGSATSIVSGVTYRPMGPVDSYTLGNGQLVTRTYDANYAPTDVNSRYFNAHYDRDAANQIVGLRDTPTTGTPETHVYDALHRLTAVQSATFNESYTYNKTGDRLSKTSDWWGSNATGTYTYQSGTHGLTDVGGQSTAVDANGAMTKSHTNGIPFTYIYDGRGRVTEIHEYGLTEASFAYNVFDQRIRKSSISGNTLRFVYNEAGQLLGEYGASSRDYIWMDGLSVGTLDGTIPAYVVVDGMGTPRRVDVGGGIGFWQWPAFTNPFGEAQASGWNYDFNLRFPGQYYDPEAFVVYNGHRYYDPATGRYIQSDPIGLSGGPSTYAYVGSHPFDAVDPSGLEEENERELFEPINVAGPINAASYRILYARIKQINPEFEDPIASPIGEIEYTPQDVARLQEAYGRELLDGCHVLGTNARGQITSRSSFRDATVRAAWREAEEGPNGGRLCPTCSKEVMVPPKSGVNRDWDVSHYPSWSNRSFPPGTPRPDIIDNYQEGTSLECPACNRSRGNNDARLVK